MQLYTQVPRFISWRNLIAHLLAKVSKVWF